MQVTACRVLIDQPALVVKRIIAKVLITESGVVHASCCGRNIATATVLICKVRVLAIDGLSTAATTGLEFGDKGVPAHVGPCSLLEEHLVVLIDIVYIIEPPRCLVLWRKGSSLLEVLCLRHLFNFMISKCVRLIIAEETHLLDLALGSDR